MLWCKFDPENTNIFPSQGLSKVYSLLKEVTTAQRARCHKHVTALTETDGNDG